MALFAEDLSPFIADFGDAGTLNGAPVMGIFDAPAVTQALGDMQATATEPQYQLPTASVPSAIFGKPLVISTGAGAGTYTVREHLPDGTGMSLLLLAKA